LHFYLRFRYISVLFISLHFRIHCIFVLMLSFHIIAFFMFQILHYIFVHFMHLNNWCVTCLPTRTNNLTFVQKLKVKFKVVFCSKKTYEKGRCESLTLRSIGLYTFYTFAFHRYLFHQWKEPCTLQRNEFPLAFSCITILLLFANEHAANLWNKPFISSCARSTNICHIPCQDLNTLGSTLLLLHSSQLTGQGLLLPQRERFWHYKLSNLYKSRLKY
jgi:hypothetical protein